VKVVFLGTPEVAVPSLVALASAGHDLRLVVTQPDRPSGRSGTPVPPPVKRAAAARGIAVEQPLRLRGQSFVERLRTVAPDVLVIVAYGRILSRAVLDVATHGAVNLHFSLLPAYRGAAPVQWALARGETKTGLTTMKLNERMDEGDILLQQEVVIEADEHAPALRERLSTLGSPLLTETLARLAAGTLEPRPQDPTQASLAPLLSQADGAIRLSLTAREIAGRVRGFDPWPGVWVRRGDRRLRLVAARELHGTVPDVPGQVLELTPEGLIMACGSGTRLALRRVQPQGRKALDVRDAVNGRQILPGDRLEACS
jgi:methionyl-tRNA formyltransferase